MLKTVRKMSWQKTQLWGLYKTQDGSTLRIAAGWAIDRRAKTTLVDQTLHMAWSTREIHHGSIIHADHGTKPTSWAFTSNVDKYGLRVSLRTVGDCFHNAIIESFWARMQSELLNRRKWATIVELRTEMADYIDSFPNHQRRHSSLHVLTPSEYENLYAPTLQLTWARPKNGGQIIRI